VLELRAATSLSWLWQQQGRKAAAHELLAEVHGWFIIFNLASALTVTTIFEIPMLG
jgi:hypothetical protein